MVHLEERQTYGKVLVGIIKPYEIKYTVKGTRDTEKRPVLKIWSFCKRIQKNLRRTVWKSELFGVQKKLGTKQKGG